MWSPESVCPTITKLRILSSQPSCQTEQSRNLKQESINLSCFCYQCNYTTWTRLLIFPPLPTLYQPWVITLLGDSNSSSLSKIYHSTTSVEGNTTRPHITKDTASDGRRPLLSTSTWGWTRGPCQAVMLLYCAVVPCLGDCQVQSQSDCTYLTCWSRAEAAAQHCQHVWHRLQQVACFLSCTKGNLASPALW